MTTEKNIMPETISFYRKKMGEIQFTPAPPRLIENKQKAGVVFIEAANVLKDNPDKNDWDNKVILSFAAKDIAEFLYGVRTGANKPVNQDIINIVHTNPKTEKVVSFKVTTGNNGTFKVSISGFSKSSPDEKVNTNIYLDGKDMTLLCLVLESAIPTILGLR